jgi:hypothetical protein
MAGKPANQSPAQTLLFADIISAGGGEFRIVPRKPLSEVGTTEAARILGYKCRTSIHEQVLNHPQAKLLKWRFTPGRGKILIDLAGLLAFKEATREAGK